MFSLAFASSCRRAPCFHWDIFTLSFPSLQQLFLPTLMPLHVLTNMSHTCTGMSDTCPSHYHCTKGLWLPLAQNQGSPTSTPLSHSCLISALALHLNVHRETHLTILLNHSYNIFSIGTFSPFSFFILFSKKEIFPIPQQLTKWEVH